MPVPDAPRSPDWEELYSTAEAQSGYLTTAQAAAAGYSPQLLQKHLAAGRITRVRRGIYRLVHFPASENEELVVLWLWAERQGVFSHETALALRDLSDVLPTRVHMTVPRHWAGRRLRVPEGLVLHYADIDDADCKWFDAVPITSPLRSLQDCIDAHLSPELLEQGIREASSRGLISREDARRLSESLQRSMEEAP